MKKKKAGFTLIEMIIVIALTVVILGITSSMFTTGNKVFSDSDVKSTLQIEAQNIQEKLSDIGMEGTEVKELKAESDKVEELKIKSYFEENNHSLSSRYFTIKRNDKELSIIESKDDDGSETEISSQDISKNIKSFKIDVTDASLKFTIILSDKRQTDTLPMNFTITLRNRGITGAE